MCIRDSPDGKGFPTITYSTNDAGYNKAVAEYLQSAYAQLGITMKIDIVEWSSFTPQRRAGKMCIRDRLIGGTIRFNGHEIEKMTDKDFRKIRGNEVSIIFQDLSLIHI